MTTKLLVVADDFVVGGAYLVGVRLALALAANYRVTFACDMSSANRAPRLQLAHAGVEVIRLFAHAGELRRARWDREGACALLKRASPDKILFVDSSPRSHLAVKDAAREAAFSYLSIVNFVDKVTPAGLKALDGDVERTANAAAALIFVSAAARDDFETNYPLVVAPRLVVPNGVPDTFFASAPPSARAALRLELGIGDDETMLLLPGRLEPRKGQMLALEALAELGEGVKLVLAGYGDDAAQAGLAARVRALGLSARVAYLGPRDDMERLFDACDIVLMPSAQEADGLVAKEAMAKGRPVIASDLPSLREQGHDETCLVPAPTTAPERTVAALVDAIEALRRDPRQRDAIGERLRELAQRRFAMSAMAESYRVLLDLAPARDPSRAQKSVAPPVDRWLPVSRLPSLFKDGWSEFEPDGIWSLGAGSRISVTLPEPSTHFQWEARLSTLATQSRPRRVEVFANGRRVAVWTFTHSRHQKRTIQIVSRYPRRVFVIRFCQDSALSPFDLGLNPDRRPLGLFVASLRLATAPEGPRLWGRRAWNAWRRA